MDPALLGSRGSSSWAQQSVLLLVVALVEQGHKQPGRLRGAGRSGQSPFAQFALTVEDKNREVKLYTRSGQSTYVGGGRVEPSPPQRLPK